ncbi:helix-turn-helix domain-containing protein [Dendrosporobacter sp. 1207_IL3150]|uniref:helix-turn-helix domain-containing protein n=1 Tax=Dendrosporobacter sp. 1207_IL3150 TaxID=3084054 RepID=UPI002FDA9ADB
MYRLSRMKKGLTQKQAAELLVISRAYLCMIEKLQVKPTQEIIIKMRKLYEDNSLTV